MTTKDKKYATADDFMDPKHIGSKEFDPDTAKPMTPEEVAAFDPTSPLTEAGQVEPVDESDIAEEKAA